MTKSVLLKIELPKDFRRFKMPAALNTRLQQLLDRLDREGKLPRQEQKEAEALTDLVDMLSLMRLRAEMAVKRNAS